MKISSIAPVLNEVEFIGFSIMACLEHMHQFVYTLDEKSNDGTRDLLHHIKDKYAHEKLIILDHPTFHPHDQKAYNGAFQACLEKATGDAAMFLHPDQIITNPERIDSIPQFALAWFTHMTSYVGDSRTIISKGRCTKWKNIHKKKFGLHYYGAYGSQNEDFYHRDITGNAYKHYGTEFSKYPYQVADSGLLINHYCETKQYERRLEKMMLCLKTLYPMFSDENIRDLATKHPRVTLKASSSEFGKFEFLPSSEPLPEVITKYEAEFSAFKKEFVNA